MVHGRTRTPFLVTEIGILCFVAPGKARGKDMGFKVGISHQSQERPQSSRSIPTQGSCRTVSVKTVS